MTPRPQTRSTRRRRGIWVIAGVVVASGVCAGPATAAHDSGFLHLRLQPPPRAANAAVDVTARTSEATDDVRLRVNGKRVRGALKLTRQRRHHGQLSASHGLRFGTNRIVVTARGHHGRWDREGRTVHIPRTAPLAGAGRDRRARLGRAVRLDGRDSVSARYGRALRYRWTIAVRPAGSRATLRGATTARPTIVPDVAGRYRLSLRVKEAPRRAKGSAAQANPVAPPVQPVTPPVQPVTPPLAPVTPSGPGPAPLNPAASTLTSPTQPLRNSTASVELTVPPPLPPIGWPVSTIPSGPAGIQVGSTLYPAASTFAQMLVFDRGTLAPVANYDIDASTAAELSQLLSATNATQFVIVTGGGRAVQASSAVTAAVNDAVTRLGGDPSLMPPAAIAAGEWSVAGTPGSAAGSAKQSFGLGGVAGGEAGDLRGQVQFDNTGNTTVVATDPVTFDSSVPGQPANTNAMQVAGSTYTSATIPAGSAGFQVLQLDQGTLELVGNQTFVTNPAGGGADDGAISDMAWMLTGAAIGQPASLVIVQSINSPRPLDQTWIDQLSATPTAPVALGATTDVISGLDGTGGYALVGGTSLPTGAAEEQSEPLTGNPPRITGQLTRNSRWQYQPANTTFFSVEGPEMTQVAYQAPTPWPETDTPGKILANAWIAKQLGFAYDDVRVAYWEVDNAAWSDLYDQLSALQYPTAPSPSKPVTPPLDPVAPASDPLGPSATATARQAPTTTPIAPVTTPVQPVTPPAEPIAPVTTPVQPVTPPAEPIAPAPPPVGFTNAEFQAVKAQLLTEFPMVGNVRALMTVYQTDIFATAQQANLVNLQAIAEQVEQDVDPPPKATTTVNWWAITEDILRIGGAFLGPIPGVGFAAAPFNAAAAGMNIASAITFTTGGTTIRQAITATADQLAEDVEQKYQATIGNVDHVGDLLVSDYGKLTTASAASLSQWALSTQGDNTTTAAFERSATQLFYARIMGMVYNHYSLGLQPPKVKSGVTANWWAYCRLLPPFPFGAVASQQDYGQYQALYGFDSTGQPQYNPQVLASQTLTSKILNPVYPQPPASLTRELFDTKEQGGQIGLYQPWFYAQFKGIAVTPGC